MSRLIEARVPRWFRNRFKDWQEERRQLEEWERARKIAAPWWELLIARARTLKDAGDASAIVEEQTHNIVSREYVLRLYWGEKSYRAKGIKIETLPKGASTVSLTDSFSGQFVGLKNFPLYIQHVNFLGKEKEGLALPEQVDFAIAHATACERLRYPLYDWAYRRLF